MWLVVVCFIIAEKIWDVSIKRSGESGLICGVKGGCSFAVDKNGY